MEVVMSSGNSSGGSATDHWIFALLDLLLFATAGGYTRSQDTIADWGDVVEGDTVSVESLEFFEDVEPDPSGILGAFVLFMDDDEDCE